MKILYLCSWYRREPSAFEGVFFAEQAAVFAGLSHDVGIACCRTASIHRPVARPLWSVSQNEPLAFGTCGTVYRGTAMSIPKLRDRNILHLRWQYGRFLKSVLRDFGRPDVIHIQSAFDAGILGYRLLKALQLGYVITEHASFLSRGLVSSRRSQELVACLHSADWCFAVSRSLMQDLRSAGAECDIHVLPNIYDSSNFYVGKAPPRDEFRFIVVCALNQNKNVALLLHALSRVRMHRRNCKLVVVGEGGERERLQQLAVDLRLGESVDFVGTLARPDVADRMRTSHCLVSASRVETFGVSIIEALACGLPVIATRSGGPEDIVAPSCGMLVPVDDVQGLESAMLRMIESYDCSEPARQARADYAASRFSSRTFSERLIPVYEATAARNRCRR